MSSEFHPDNMSEVALASYLSRHTRRPNHTYNVILSLFFMIVVSLPFIFLDVTVDCPGMLRPIVESNAIRTSASGFISSLHIKENERVKKGDLLIEVRSTGLEHREAYIYEKIKENHIQAKDIRELISLISASSGRGSFSLDLASELYKQSYAAFLENRRQTQIRLNKAIKDYDRNSHLFQGGVIAATDLEVFKYEADKAQIEMDQLTESQISVWLHDAAQLEEELSELNEQLTAVIKEKEALNVTAPINGTIQNLAGISEGSYVASDQELGYISPDTFLIAEIHVPPNDIGLLYVDMGVTIQVNAFNRNQWGFLNGKILEISEDVRLSNDHPFFNVKCKIERAYMTLKDGHKGELKKGMTVQARFCITRRSLWQLMFDKADDWMNPHNQ